MAYKQMQHSSTVSDPFAALEIFLKDLKEFNLQTQLISQVGPISMAYDLATYPNADGLLPNAG